METGRVSLVNARQFLLDVLVFFGVSGGGFCRRGFLVNGRGKALECGIRLLERHVGAVLTHASDVIGAVCECNIIVGYQTYGRLMKMDSYRAPSRSWFGRRVLRKNGVAGVDAV